MAFKQKDNSGALFKNDKKSHEAQPDYTGNALIGGTEYFMSAWLKTSDSGRKYFSFSFTERDQKKSQKSEAPF